MMDVTVDRVKPEDLTQLLTLFTEAIQNIDPAYYNDQQKMVWLSATKHTDRWLHKIATQYFIKAVVSQQLVGFGSIKEDYLDLLYVHPSYQNKGIAQVIFDHLSRYSKQQGHHSMKTDASRAAKNFFLKNGFAVVKENEIKREGVVLVNYSMECTMDIC